MKNKYLIITMMTMAMLLLTGCEDGFAKLTVSPDRTKLKVEVVAETDPSNRGSLLDAGYTYYPDAKIHFEEDVYSVIPKHLVDKFKLSFSDGVFLVANSGRTIGLDKKYLEQYQKEGKPLGMTKLAANRYELVLPLEKLDDPESVSGIIVFEHYKPIWEWIDPTNILHDDSDHAKAVYLPFYSVTKNADGSVTYVLSDRARVEGSDVGNGFIILGLLNLNGGKDRDYVAKRARGDGFFFYNNYGSNFIIPILGIFNENVSKKEKPLQDRWYFPSNRYRH